MKRILSILIALAMLIGAAPLAVFALVLTCQYVIALVEVWTEALHKLLRVEGSVEASVGSLLHALEEEFEVREFEPSVLLHDELAELSQLRRCDLVACSDVFSEIYDLIHQPFLGCAFAVGLVGCD